MRVSYCKPNNGKKEVGGHCALIDFLVRNNTTKMHHNAPRVFMPLMCFFSSNGCSRKKRGVLCPFCVFFVLQKEEEGTLS